MCNINFFMIMRKWKYLVAMLVLAGATTTFTGCIDNDEPAGIEELRSAKAELLRAKATVEAAKVAQVQADAALAQAQAELVKAQAQAVLLKAEWEKAIAEAESAEKIKELQAQAAKALAEAEASLAKAEAERQSAALLEAQALAVLKSIQAELEETQQRTLQGYVDAYNTQVTAYNEAYLAYLDAVKDYNDALAGLETESSTEYFERKNLEKAVEAAKKELANAQQAIVDAEAELENAKGMTVDELIAKRDAYNAEMKSYNDSIALNTLALDEFKAENKAEDDKLTALKEEVEKASKFTVSAYKNETAKGNATLNTKLGELNGYDNGVFAYDKAERNISYNETTGELNQIAELATVEGWLEALEGAYDSKNDQINDSLDTKDKYAKAVEKAQKNHDAAVAAWQILVDARYGKATEYTTEYVAAAVKKYNTEFAKIAPAVKAYNDAIENFKAVVVEVGDAAAEKALEASLEDKYTKYYMAAVSDTLTKYTTLKGIDKWNALNANGDATIEDFEYAFGDSVANVIAKVADKEMEAFKKTGAYVDLQNEAEEAKTTALSEDWDLGKDKSKLQIAAAKVKFDGSKIKVSTEWPKTLVAWNAYKDTLAADYGQLLTSKGLTKTYQNVKYAAMEDEQVTADLGIDINTLYTTIQNEKTVDGDKVKVDSVYTVKISDSVTETFKYIQVNGSDVTDAEFTALTKAAVDEETTNDAWAKKSAAAWGDEYADRMLPVEEDAENIGGTLKELVDAKAALAEYEDGVNINETLDTLIAEITAQKAVLEAEIAAAEAAVADKMAAVEAQEAVIDEMLAPFKEKEEAYLAAQKKATAFYNAYMNVTNSIDGLTTQDEIDTAIEIAMTSLADALAVDLETLEDAIVVAEMVLMENANAESIAVANLKFKMEKAEFAMNQAKAAMEMAQSYLNAYLASLAE